MLANASFSTIKKYKLLAIYLLLSFGLIACAQTRVDAATQMPAASNDLKVTLMAIAKLANLDSPTINIKALSVLAQTDFEQLIKNEALKSESITVKYIVPINLNSGITSIKYSKKLVPILKNSSVTPSANIPKNIAKHIETAIIIFNPTILCITDRGVREAWSQQFIENQFSPLSYGAGNISPTSSIHRDVEEKKRRGDGPIEMTVNVIEPKNILHESSFKFEFNYWTCPIGVILERKYQ
jgi:hypothetical protein